MTQLTQNPPEGFIQTLAWCVQWIFQLRNRLGSGGGGSVELPNTQIGFGNGTSITSNVGFTYNQSIATFTSVGAQAYPTMQVFNSNGNIDLFYQSLISDFTIGTVVTGDITGATGTIIANDTGNGILTVIPISGTFDGTDTSYSDSDGGSALESADPSANGNVTMDNNIRGLYYDPPTHISNGTITLPSNPLDGIEFIIKFGGTLTTGIIIRTLLFIGNVGQTIIESSLSNRAGAGISIKYRESITTWYIG